jgi:hypothetical protein
MGSNPGDLNGGPSSRRKQYTLAEKSGLVRLARSSSVLEVSRNTGVPCGMLRRWMKASSLIDEGLISSPETRCRVPGAGGRRRLLSQDFEEELVQWMLEQCSSSTGLKKIDVIEKVERFVSVRNGKERKVSRSWFAKFLHEHRFRSGPDGLLVRFDLGLFLSSSSLENEQPPRENSELPREASSLGEGASDRVSCPPESQDGRPFLGRDEESVQQFFGNVVQYCLRQVAQGVRSHCEILKASIEFVVTSKLSVVNVSKIMKECWLTLQRREVYDDTAALSCVLGAFLSSSVDEAAPSDLYDYIKLTVSNASRHFDHCLTESNGFIPEYVYKLLEGRVPPSVLKEFGIEWDVVEAARDVHESTVETDGTHRSTYPTRRPSQRLRMMGLVNKGMLENEDSSDGIEVEYIDDSSVTRQGGRFDSLHTLRLNRREPPSQSLRDTRLRPFLTKQVPVKALHGSRQL